MRTIKFKAKTVRQDKWVYGSLVKTPRETHIEWYEDSIRNSEQVMTTTVCQFTGLKDKNGKEVWEHDILASPCLKGEIVFFNGCFRVKKDNGLSCAFSSLIVKDDKMDYCCVVGNKFDRKEE